MTTALLTAPTEADYSRIFWAECAVAYPAIDAFEARMGYAVNRAKLEGAARVLACPMKEHAPNWQHGRVIYAAARSYFASVHGFVNVLDIGTAKGFSALCLQWALEDAGRTGQVSSVDVLDPAGTSRRNTVAELDGPVTLRKIIAPWPEADRIHFACSTGSAWLAMLTERIHVAFVDGKHSQEAVAAEAALLAKRQIAGDLVIFDDAHVSGVARAIQAAERHYQVEYIDVLAHRRYAVGVRRG